MRIFLLMTLLLGCSDSESTPESSDGTEPAAEACSAELVEGSEVGQIPADADIYRCAGGKLSLRSLVCGHRLTLLDIGTGHLAECVQTTDVYSVSPDFAQMKADGLQIIQIFRQDPDGEIPTSVWCEDYVAQHGVEDYEFLMDPLLETNAIAGFMDLPLNLILDHEGRVVQRWAATIPKNKIERLQELLNAQPSL